MTWRCATCNHANIWWKNACERCYVPTRGFNPTQPEDPLLQQMREAFRIIDQQPPISAQGGCAACRLSGICNCTRNQGYFC